MKSFLQGKKTLPAEPLRPPPQLAAAHPAGCKPLQPPAGKPSVSELSAHVEVVKEGDKVVRLIVNCRCGERIEIDCLYSAGR